MTAGPPWLDSAGRKARFSARLQLVTPALEGNVPAVTADDILSLPVSLLRSTRPLPIARCCR